MVDGKYLWSEQGSDQNLQQQCLKKIRIRAECI